VPVKVKICGITNLQDALAAAEAGADALGFVFYDRSPRGVTPARVSSITPFLPPISKVGVFVDPDPSLLRRAVLECGIDTLQFHGGETPEFLKGLNLDALRAPVQMRFSPMPLISAKGVCTMKAFRIENEASLDELPKFSTDLWLLDSFVPGTLGGTGAVFNWNLAIRAKAFGTPIVLAGGLTVENVGDAVGKVAPYGVDVSSGVEAAPGRKDLVKVREFIAAARSR
jgi:phosphoribosylanthranilate isomerase